MKRIIKNRTSQIALLLFISLWITSQLIFYYWTFITGVTRPLWDVEWKTKFGRYTLIIPNFGFDPNDIEESCSLHNFSIRSPDNPVNRIFFTSMFSIELDILEMQLNELHEVVDYFVLAESNITFRGKPKPMLLTQNRERFRKFWKQIVLITVIPTKFYGFEAEGQTRDEALYLNLFSNMVTMEGKTLEPLSEFDWVAVCDMDEMIRKSFLQVVRACETPNIIQLDFGTSYFKYSFEFKLPVVDNAWDRQPANIQRWGKKGRPITHEVLAPVLYVDAGWHCSWCFQYLEEAVFKMVSYSHSFLDEDKTRQYLDFDWIQRVYCEGLELDGRVAEKWTMKGVISLLGGTPSHMTVNDLPPYFLANKKKFSYLLPGNCKRKLCPKTGCVLDPFFYTNGHFKYSKSSLSE